MSFISSSLQSGTLMIWMSDRASSFKWMSKIRKLYIMKVSQKRFSERSGSDLRTLLHLFSLSAVFSVVINMWCEVSVGQHLLQGFRQHIYSFLHILGKWLLHSVDCVIEHCKHLDLTTLIKAAKPPSRNNTLQLNVPHSSFYWSKRTKVLATNCFTHILKKALLHMLRCGRKQGNIENVEIEKRCNKIRIQNCNSCLFF